MSLRNRNKSYYWARFGGMDNLDELNKITYEVELRFPIISVLADKTNNFASIKVDLNDELKVKPPSSVYYVDWGDGANKMLNFREFTDEWDHTYERQASKNKEPIRYTVNIYGHNLVQMRNPVGLDYIHQVSINLPNSAEDGLIIVRSVD